jgi:hypothetical protein
LIGWVIMRLLMRLTRIGDVEGSSQFIRAGLFALVLANMASFIASAQAYSDAVLALTAGFFAGALFATATLDERLAARTPIAEAAEKDPATTAAQPA